MSVQRRGLRLSALVLALGLITAASGTLAVGAPIGRSDAATKAADYLAGRFTASSPPNAIAEVLIAFSAVGLHKDVVTQALAEIKARGSEDATQDAAYAGRISMGLVAYGHDPSRFGGFDYVQRIDSAYSASTGSYDERNRIYADALAALGLLAAGRTLPKKAIDFLLSNECPGGGFGHDARCPTGADTDTTAMVGSTLAASGLPLGDGVFERALLFLRLTQNADGGFGLSAATPTNANSTGLTLSFFAAVGQQVEAWSVAEGRNPAEALLALQNEDGGFRYRADRPSSNHYATVQTIPGLMARSYPPPRPVGPLPDSTSAARSNLQLGRMNSIAPSRTPPTESAAGAASPITPQRSTSVAIRFSNGDTENFCVWLKPDATGVDALEGTGLAITKRDYGGPLGTAICSIRGEGNPIGACPAAEHWHYWRFDAGRWTDSSLGPSNLGIGMQGAEGWSWSSNGDVTPPAIPKSDGVCSPSKTLARTFPQGVSKRPPFQVVALVMALAMMGLLALRIKRLRSDA